MNGPQDGPAARVDAVRQITRLDRMWNSKDGDGVRQGIPESATRATMRPIHDRTSESVPSAAGEMAQPPAGAALWDRGSWTGTGVGMGLSAASADRAGDGAGSGRVRGRDHRGHPPGAPGMRDLQSAVLLRPAGGYPDGAAGAERAHELLRVEGTGLVLVGAGRVAPRQGFGVELPRAGRRLRAGSG